MNTPQRTTTIGEAFKTLSLFYGKMKRDNTQNIDIILRRLYYGSTRLISFYSKENSCLLRNIIIINNFSIDIIQNYSFMEQLLNITNSDNMSGLESFLISNEIFVLVSDMFICIENHCNKKNVYEINRKITWTEFLLKKIIPFEEKYFNILDLTKHQNVSVYSMFLKKCRMHISSS